MSNARDISNLVTESIPSALGTAGQLLAVNAGATAGEWVSQVPNTPINIIEYIPGTYTYTAKIDCTVVIRLVGGGGAGMAIGQDDEPNIYAWVTGGGAGGYVEKTVSLTTGDVLNLVVGSRGTAEGNNTRQPNSHAAFNTLYEAGVGSHDNDPGNATTCTGPNGLSLSAGGGSEGQAYLQDNDNTLNVAITGGVGGTATGGDINRNGASTSSFSIGDTIPSTSGYGVRMAFAKPADLGLGISTDSAYDDLTAIAVINGTATDFSDPDLSSLTPYSTTTSTVGSLTNSYLSTSGSNLSVATTDSIFGAGGQPNFCLSATASTGTRTSLSGDGGRGFATITLISID